MSTPTPAVKQFGLTQVYISRDTPQVDIVFVHGLNGHPHDSWTSRSSGCFWPVDLLPDVLAPIRPRILTYGYNANVTAFTDGVSRDTIVSHAETLASSLFSNRNLRDCPDRPIIFVCHSLGGLVVKRALIYCRSLSNEKTEHLRSIYVSTFGILFLGTPHNGSDMAKWGILLHNICRAVLPKKVMEASPQLIQALRTNNETLQNINSLFADIMPRFHIYFFHETRSTDVRGTRQVIVDEASAAPYIEGVERMSIEADHSHMCKFEDENAPGYEVVAEALLRYSRQAPAVITERWGEEKKARAAEKRARAREIFDDNEQSTPELGTTDGSVTPLALGSGTESRDYAVSDVGNSAVLSSSYSHKEPPYFVAPAGFHPNATFFGMQKELDVLHTRLFRAKARGTRLTAVLISGVPGSGKTHLARQYVFTQRECYPGGVFWVDAKPPESMFKCYWEIAQAASLIDPQKSDPENSDAYVNAVRDWLQTRTDWLLIFDGIGFDGDEDLNDFKELLPWKEKCSIIYTSVDSTLRKKHRLFEPYCLQISKLKVEDACSLLYKDLSIKKPTPEQSEKAIELVKHYECLPLAIHAIGHRLNATGRPIEKYRIKSHVIDKKLAEPFLGIMNDLFRLQYSHSLNLINLLSFLSHSVPVGLLNFGRASMTAQHAEILTKPQAGDTPDLDETLATLIHYGLIERTSDAASHFSQGSFKQHSSQQSADEKNGQTTGSLSESQTDSSMEGFFSIYRGSSAVDVLKIHSVVQGFCRDELRIRDEEVKADPKFKENKNKQDPGYYDSWLIVTTHFLCKSYESAKEKMAHYEECGLVRDYREYETHASRLAEHFPKKITSTHPPVIPEAREKLRQLMKNIKSEISRISSGSMQESLRNQKSVFDRSSSSSSSVPESSADEGLSRNSTGKLDELLPQAESPQEMGTPPLLRLDLFPPHIFRHRQAGNESEDGYEADEEEVKAPRISPALSQASQSTEKPKPPSKSPTPSAPSDDGEWQVVDRHSKARSTKERQAKKRNKDRRRPRSAKPAPPLVRVSSVQGRGSSSRPSSSSEVGNSAVLSSEAEQALFAVRRSSNSQPRPEVTKPTAGTVPAKKENIPTYASVAARVLEARTPTRRPASSPARGLDGASDLQMKASVESLDRHAFASPLSHELTSHELEAEPLSRSTYSEPGYNLLNPPLAGLGFESRTAPGSRLESRRPSLAPVEPVRHLSSSTPTLVPWPPPSLPYEEDIAVTMPRRTNPMPRAPGRAARPKLPPVDHPSAIMPGVPLTATVSAPPVGYTSSRPAPVPLSRDASGLSHQSWASEPVPYPSQVSPASDVANASAIPQQQLISGAGSWAVDERLKNGPGWNPDMEAQLLHFGGHRVDVRDARQRLLERNRLQTPRHVPTYQLQHPNLSGCFDSRSGNVYAFPYDLRSRSGSTRPRRKSDGLGERDYDESAS